ncbi:hypothetical protein CRG98_023514 [Punica granatum]|uniref:Uncharacterized protein n=1 Tax=Punica granatum TaxID=22663 RepID=A0A2I0JJF9_PUNGR|nr:hypothetical protein CRG98_023514 [Punica granatum]
MVVGLLGATEPPRPLLSRFRTFPVMPSYFNHDYGHRDRGNCQIWKGERVMDPREPKRLKAPLFEVRPRGSKASSSLWRSHPYRFEPFHVIHACINDI